MENLNFINDSDLDLADLFDCETAQTKSIEFYRKPETNDYISWFAKQHVLMNSINRFHDFGLIETGLIQFWNYTGTNKPVSEFCFDYKSVYDVRFLETRNQKPPKSKLEILKPKPLVLKPVVNDEIAIEQTKNLINRIWKKFHETAQTKPPKTAQTKILTKVDFFKWFHAETNRQKTAFKPVVDYKKLNLVSLRLMRFLKNAKKRQMIIDNLRSIDLETNPFLLASNVQKRFTTNRPNDLDLAVTIQHTSLMNYYVNWKKANQIDIIPPKSLQTFEKNLKLFRAVKPYIQKHNATGVKKAVSEYRKANRAVSGKLRDYNRMFNDVWADSPIDIPDSFPVAVCGLQVVSLPVAKLPSLKFWDSETNSWIDRKDIMAISGKDNIQIKTWCKSYLLALPNNQCQLFETFQYSGKHCFRTYSKQQCFNADILDIQPKPLATGFVSAWKTDTRNFIKTINESMAVSNDVNEAKKRIVAKQTKTDLADLRKAKKVLAVLTKSGFTKPDNKPLTIEDMVSELSETKTILETAQQQLETAKTRMKPIKIKKPLSKYSKSKMK